MSSIELRAAFKSQFAAQGTLFGDKPEAGLREISGFAESLAMSRDVHMIIVANRPSLVQGEGTGEPTEIMPGAMLFIPANSSVEVRFPDSFDALIALCPVREGSVETCGAGSHKSGVPDRMTLIISPRQISAISEVAKRVTASPRHDNRDCITAVTNLLMSEVVHATCRTSEIQARTSVMNDRALKSIDDFIDDHLEETLSLEDLAQFSELSVNQFSRHFKNSTGVSPFQYIINKRVQRAREMLEHGGAPIAEIAYATGFSSQSHLTETFKRHLGMPPRAYQREYAAAA